MLLACFRTDQFSVKKETHHESPTQIGCRTFYLRSSCWGRSRRAALIHAADSEPQHRVVTPQQIATANDLSTAFRNVGKQIEPSVVNITVHKTVKGGGSAPFDNDLLRRFFNNNPEFAPFGRKFPDDGNRQGQGQDQENGGSLEEVGTGSGFILEVDGNAGYILTNNHVAGGATEMIVTLADGRRIENAKLVGADPKSDLAVIKITADHLIAAKWGDSSMLRKGDWILAFGSPFGYIGSMTHGIVSAWIAATSASWARTATKISFRLTPRSIPATAAARWSISTAKWSASTPPSLPAAAPSPASDSPSPPTKPNSSTLPQSPRQSQPRMAWRQHRRLSRNPKEVASFGFKGTTGVLVERTFPNTPAIGKLQPGDIIESLDSKPVQTILRCKAIAAMTPDSELKMGVWRQNAEVPVTVKLGTQPQNVNVATDHNSADHQGVNNPLGMTLTDANDELARQFKLDENHQGELVTHVKPRFAR